MEKGLLGGLGVVHELEERAGLDDGAFCEDSFRSSRNSAGLADVSREEGVEEDGGSHDSVSLDDGPLVGAGEGLEEEVVVLTVRGIRQQPRGQWKGWLDDDQLLPAVGDQDRDRRVQLVEGLLCLDVPLEVIEVDD